MIYWGVIATVEILVAKLCLEKHRCSLNICKMDDGFKHNPSHSTQEAGL